MFPQLLQQQIEACGIVAVVVIDHPEDALPLAEALLAGGVSAMELTLRTPTALTALRKIAKQFPEMLVGAGTVLTSQQVLEVQEAGGAFAVAPGTNPAVLRAAAEAKLPFAPGVMTPSEIEIAIEYGCRLLKFFPAEPLGGLHMLKAISAPYLHLGIRYIPLGGLNAQNMTSYLELPQVSALGGSWLAPREAITHKDWATITTNAAVATTAIHALRRPPAQS